MIMRRNSVKNHFFQGVKEVKLKSKRLVKIVVEVMCTYMCTVHTQQCSVQFMDECDTACYEVYMYSCCLTVQSTY